MLEQELLEKLKKIERLHAGATTPGEMDAAADAILRIKRRLADITKVEVLIEYRFTFHDDWSKQLFTALLQRYAIRSYRYSRQRYTTVMARLPKSFVDKTLWPEYSELNKILKTYLEGVTKRVISEAIHADTGEEEVIPGGFLQ
jgi:hypothetical protein